MFTLDRSSPGMSLQKQVQEGSHINYVTYPQQRNNLQNNDNGSILVSGKLPTYDPSPNPSFCRKWEVSV